MNTRIYFNVLMKINLGLCKITTIPWDLFNKRWFELFEFGKAVLDFSWILCCTNLQPDENPENG